MITCDKCQSVGRTEIATDKVVGLFFFPGNDPELMKDFNLEKLKAFKRSKQFGMCSFAISEGPNLCNACRCGSEMFFKESPQYARTVLKSMYVNLVRELSDFSSDVIPDAKDSSLQIISLEEFEEYKEIVSLVRSEDMIKTIHERFESVISLVNCGKGADCEDCTETRKSLRETYESLKDSPEKLLSFILAISKMLVNKALEKENEGKDASFESESTSSFNLDEVIPKDIPEDIDFGDIFRKQRGNGTDQDRVHNRRFE